ncbi:NAD(P)-dependent dehydrogenase (short-subunit alcohol dehydrogenase family) [Rhizobium sp. BK529]|uniref:SDR family oxidoreductase n=1 Tax=Rhizobium sp. BK529 TaxID=2586983 RepID=UPI001621C80A|nr:SDR family oxidoreductase [Rhizobium sp. BK529]MBB3594893.1 NAD(P)-dependent dehydrogenase (short-subunit alcohol dehydrogenase family) [Rhizobium sp. BK529]
MSTILISGANRGIGFELARQFAADGWTVLGTARDPSGAGELDAISGVTVLPLEVTKGTSIEALCDDLDGRPIDVLIANAGIAFNLEAKPAEVTREDFLKVVETNTFAPLALAAALKPNLLAGELKIATAMSSLMSSIGANDWGSQYTYRASKTGLNAVWSSLAAEWRPDGIICTLLRPGLVATRMTNFSGIPVETSVAGMKAVVSGLTMSDSGRIIGYDGIDVPW